MNRRTFITRIAKSIGAAVLAKVLPAPESAGRIIIQGRPSPVQPVVFSNQTIPMPLRLKSDTLGAFSYAIGESMADTIKAELKHPYLYEIVDRLND